MAGTRCEIHPPLRCFAHAGPRLSRPHAFVAVRGLGRKLFGRSFERPTQFCRQKHAGVHERLVRSTQHSVSSGAVQNAYPSSHKRRRRTVTQCRRHHRHGTGLLMAHNYTAPVAIGSACAWIFGRLGPHLLYRCSLERVGGCLVNVKLVKSMSTTCFERALYLF